MYKSRKCKVAFKSNQAHASKLYFEDFISEVRIHDKLCEKTHWTRSVATCVDCSKNDSLLIEMEDPPHHLLQYLPDEILIRIFWNLSPATVLKVASVVCKQWRQVAADDQLWRRFCKVRWKQLPSMLFEFFLLDSLSTF
jgi:hypothetical protein